MRFIVTVSEREPQFTSQVWKAFFSQLWVCFQVTTHNPTANQREPIITWRLLCFVLHPAIHLTGAHTSPGLNMLTILMSSATGMSPFTISLGYQPPLFPEQEEEVAVPSVQAYLRQCRSIWKAAHTALLRTASRNRDGPQTPETSSCIQTRPASLAIVS